MSSVRPVSLSSEVLPVQYYCTYFYLSSDQKQASWKDQLFIIEGSEPIREHVHAEIVFRKCFTMPKIYFVVVIVWHADTAWGALKRQNEICWYYNSMIVLMYKYFFKYILEYSQSAQRKLLLRCIATQYE